LVFILLGFLFFRLFDITKPFGIKALEKLPGGFGIVLDDVMAAIYANLALQAVSRLWALLV
jgi:phosphatidylglycerophosphatase A